MKTDFFITYHHNDELAARWIAGALKDVPFSILMESWDFLPGNQPQEKIEHMTAVASCALVLLSERFLQSGMDAESWQAVTETFDTNAVVLLRIDSCDVEKALGAVTYTDLFGIKEGEARKRLLAAVGAPTADKKEPVPLRVTAMTREEVLEKRKAELEKLLTTTIKHNYHMKLDLEQEVEKEVEIENEKTGKKEKRKQWVWEAVELEAVLKDGNNYILVNPSGMGKTTFLTHVACVLLDCAGDYPFVPLFNTCIALNNREGSIANFIHQRVESFYNNSQTAVVHGECENLCILLDALDQARFVDDIVSSLQIHDKYHYYKKAKILLSSRQNTADKVKQGFRKIRLKLPEDDEVKHYLGEENYKKLEGHIAASKELVIVPVLLEMLKTITEKGYDASKLWNRADLYTEFTRILMDQERSKPRFWQDPLSIRHFIENELEQALEKIAFFSLAENRILEIEKEKLVKYCETPEKKEALLNIGIILELFEDREQKIVFRHQSFQAYFAGRYIYNQQPEIFRELIGDIAFFYSDVWYEVMRFFVGLEKSLQKAEAIIEAIIEKNKNFTILKKNNLLDKKKNKKSNLTDALRLIFAVFLMSEAQASYEFLQRIYEQLGDLFKNKNQYWIFLNSNTYKFNKPNDEQRRSVFHNVLPLLRHKNNDIRNVIVEFLGKIGTSKDIRLLEHMLMDKDENIRIDTIKILVNIGTSKPIPLLVPLLRDADYRVQEAATEAFGKIVTAKDIPFLEPLLRDENKDMRSEAAKSFGKSSTAKDIPFLQYMFMDEDEEDSRIAIIEILGNIGTSEHIPLLEPLLKDENEYIRREAAETLGKIGTSKDIPLLKPLLRDENYFVRYTVASALGEIGTSKDIPLLEPLFKDEHEDVLIGAAEALGKIGTSKDILLLEPLLRDRSADVQRAAIQAIGKIGTSKDIPLLDPMLRDEDAHVRWAAVEVIREIGNSSHIPLLNPLLRDECEYVRGAAVYALGEIGASKDIPLLEPLLRDKKNNVRFAIAVALGKIGTIEHIPFLEPLLRDKDGDVRYEAAEAFGNIGDIEHLPLLEPLLRDDFVHNSAAKALVKIVTIKDIPLLETMIRDKDRNVRVAATEVLRKIGTSKDIPFLKPLLRDEEEYIRSEATEALGNIGTSKDIHLLEPLLSDKDRWVRKTSIEVLGRIGTSEHAHLLEPMISDEDENVRQTAIEIMGKIGTPKCIPLIEPMLKNKEFYIRRITAEAIENIYKRSTPKLRLDRVVPTKKEEKVLPIKLFSGQVLHILHISDIHYALEKDPTITCIFREFLQDIQKWCAQQNNEKIHSICLTGDIAQSGQKNQYEFINEKINAILKTTGCSKDQIFIIPGNHDFQEYDKISPGGKTILEQVRENKMNIDTGVLSNFENYHEFHEKFNHYYEFVETSGYHNSLPLTDKRSNSPKPWYSRELQDFPVRIIGLNSALFCLKEFSEYGKIRMGTHQFHEAFFQGKPGNIPKDELVILLTHHPVNWLAENEYEDYTTLMERYAIIHLHGHIHRTKIRKLFSITGSSYISVGTGSLYGEKGLGDINTYHIITLDFKKEEVHIWARRWIPEHGCWGVYDNDINNTFPFPGRHY